MIREAAGKALLGTGTGESTLPGRVAHVSVDGRRLLTYEGSTARVYRLAEGAFRLERQEIFGSVSLETCAAISPDGRHVAQLLRDPWRFVVLGAGGTALATLTESLTELNDTGVGVRFVTDATGALYLFQGSGPYGQRGGRLALYALSGPEGGDEE
jgi:hypothetical protein